MNVTETNQESINFINKLIREQFCHETIEQINDENLMELYTSSASHQRQMKKIQDILNNYPLEDVLKIKLSKEISNTFIQPGSRGCIRGCKFNEVVNKKINELGLDHERFEICFEQFCPEYYTSEIPDWYIRELTTNKVLVGMNQLDLWGGGHQLNRGFKYILENKQHNNKNAKLLCVICNYKQLKSVNSKAYRIFKNGFENNTLCYLKNLKQIINLFFDC